MRIYLSIHILSPMLWPHSCAALESSGSLLTKAFTHYCADQPLLSLNGIVLLCTHIGLVPVRFFFCQPLFFLWPGNPFPLRPCTQVPLGLYLCFFFLPATFFPLCFDQVFLSFNALILMCTHIGLVPVCLVFLGSLMRSQLHYRHYRNDSFIYDMTHSYVT